MTAKIPQTVVPEDHDELLWSQDEYLARIFASSKRFQKEVGVENAEQAIDHVIDWADLGPDFERARVLVRMDGGMTRKRTGLGCFKTYGSIRVQIEQKQHKFEESTRNYRVSKAKFRAFYSKVLREVEKLVIDCKPIMGFNPISFQSYDIISGPWLAPDAESDHDEDTNAEDCGQVHWWLELSYEVY